MENTRSEKTMESQVNQEDTRLHFEEAIETILKHSWHGKRVIELPISGADGLVLAEDVSSDIDMPAFNRAAMDGFAFRHADSAETSDFQIAGSVAAGDRSDTPMPLRRSECVKIMTGAAVPEDADTIIPVEYTSGFDSEGATVHFEKIPSAGANIAPQGEDLRNGQVVLKEGRLLRSQEVSILASVGRPTVQVYAGPRIAFASTGEELREPGETLRPGCIRNSNSYALWSQILNARSEPNYLGILRDDPTVLQEGIGKGLEHDFLILTGGVSMGEHDYVPRIFDEFGVKLMFRKLYVRPGQPTVFGCRDGAQGRTLVFGLPGNPISALFSFDQYVMPAVRVFRGHPQPVAPLYQGALTDRIKKRKGLLTLVACVTEWHQGGFRLRPHRTHGSADIFSTSGADSIALIPTDLEVAEAGTVVSFRRLYEP